jgi:hypothetical protein
MVCQPDRRLPLATAVLILLLAWPIWIAVANFAGSLRHPGELPALAGMGRWSAPGPNSLTWPILWVLGLLQWTHHILVGWLCLLAVFNRMDSLAVGVAMWGPIGLHAVVLTVDNSPKIPPRWAVAMVGCWSLLAVAGALVCVPLYSPDALALSLLGTLACLAARVGWVMAGRHGDGDGDGDGASP